MRGGSRASQGSALPFCRCKLCRPIGLVEVAEVDFRRGRMLPPNLVLTLFF